MHAGSPQFNETRIHADHPSSTKRGFTRITQVNETRIHARSPQFNETRIHADHPGSTKRGFTRISQVNETRIHPDHPLTRRWSPRIHAILIRV